MATSKQLRNSKNQHIPKNIYSKDNDKAILQAQQDVQDYLYDRFRDNFSKSTYYIELEQSISYSIMHSFIREKGLRKEFDTSFGKRTIKPDGGVLYLRKKGNKDYRKVLLIAEVKRQGTNDIRLKEGKKRQAQGNAIERLGKNLTGIKAMMNHERITPFVCFGWGCDFDIKEGDFVLSKISMLNEFYYLNKIYVFKIDGDSNHNFFSPVSMFFRLAEWKREEMFNIMKEIAETAIRYYLY